MQLFRRFFKQSSPILNEPSMSEALAEIQKRYTKEHNPFSDIFWAEMRMDMLRDEKLFKQPQKNSMQVLVLCYVATRCMADIMSGKYHIHRGAMTSQGYQVLAFAKMANDDLRALRYYTAAEAEETKQVLDFLINTVG